VSTEKCWIQEQTDKNEGLGEKNMLMFNHHEFHTKWHKIQLQLYSQQTAPNYTTSGFNNIHLKCAQKTVWTLHWYCIVHWR